MAKLGGYLLVDFEGQDISTSKTISGIYNKIKETNKRVVACNVKLGTTVFKELTLDVKANGTSYELSNSILKITITNANAVVGEEQASGETIVFDSWNDLSDYIVDNSLKSKNVVCIYNDDSEQSSVGSTKLVVDNIKLYNANGTELSIISTTFLSYNPKACLIVIIGEVEV